MTADYLIAIAITIGSFVTVTCLWMRIHDLTKQNTALEAENAALKGTTVTPISVATTGGTMDGIRIQNDNAAKD